VNEILQNLEVISTIFEEGSIIGFIECIEDNICTYIKENPIDSILKKILNLLQMTIKRLSTQVQRKYMRRQYLQLSLSINTLLILFKTQQKPEHRMNLLLFVV
jgi:hypothetical protein